MPEFIDPVFVKTSPKRWFSMTKNERFRLVFVKTGSINSEHQIMVNTIPDMVDEENRCEQERGNMDGPEENGHLEKIKTQWSSPV